MLFIALTLMGCGEGGALDYCLRAESWRSDTDLSDGQATIVVADDCDLELTITESEIKGAGFTGDLPEVGDVIQGNLSFDVYFDMAASNSEDAPPGTYSGVIYISAENLVDDSQPKDLYAIIE